jgi:hypothetical protein
MRWSHQTVTNTNVISKGCTGTIIDDHIRLIGVRNDDQKTACPITTNSRQNSHWVITINGSCELSTVEGHSFNLSPRKKTRHVFYCTQTNKIDQQIDVVRNSNFLKI